MRGRPRPQVQVEERPVAGHGNWQRFAIAGRGPGCGAGQRVLRLVFSPVIFPYA